MNTAIVIFRLITFVHSSMLCWFDCAMARAQSQSSPILKGGVRYSKQQSATDSAKKPQISMPKSELGHADTKKTSPFTTTSREGKNKTGTFATTPTLSSSLTAKRLDPLLWPGNYFNKEVATALLSDHTRSANTWRKVASWRAGDWECTQQINTRSVKYVHRFPIEQKPMGVRSARAIETVGLQKDRNGDIWEKLRAGYWNKMDFDADTGYTFVKALLPGPSHSPEGCGEVIEFDVDKRTTMIKGVYQRRVEIQSSYIAPGFVKAEEVQTSFDAKGCAIETDWNTILLKRIRPFREVESERSDFVRYLTDKGLQSLIPVSPGSTNPASVQNKIKTQSSVSNNPSSRATNH